MSEFLERLDKALNKATAKYGSSSLNESIRKFHFHVSKVLTEGRKEDGIYYWLPDINCVWHVEPFPFRFYDNINHTKVWDKYIIQYLETIYNIPAVKFIGLFAGLPRGRISEINGNYIVHHGDDSPGNLKQVFSAFNLDANHDVAKYMSHETIFIDDYEKLCKIIGRDLGLKPLPESERWVREDED